MKFYDEIAVTEIAVAVYVAPGMGEAVHHNRPFHGLVINESGVKDYIFADGLVLHTAPGDVYYLPKGTDYRVHAIESGGCYAINFDVWHAVAHPPFVRHLPQVQELFRDAVHRFRERADLELRRCLYEILTRMAREERRGYMPSKKEALLAPAMALMRRGYTKNDLSVRNLAAHCGITEAYFRRLFEEKYGLSPKEYMISLRMDYAKRLLQSGQLSVGEAARLCGYAESCHFSREFSRRVGLSPKEYKKRSE